MIRPPRLSSGTAERLIDQGGLLGELDQGLDRVALVLERAEPSGAGPPVAQSSISMVWTKGAGVPPWSCIMQPILAVTITSGSTLAILASFRSRSCPDSSGSSRL